MLEIAWWDLPDKEVDKLISFLCSEDVNEFIEVIDKNQKSSKLNKVFNRIGNIIED